MKPTTENDNYKLLKNLSPYVYIVFIFRVKKLLLWVLAASNVKSLVTLQVLAKAFQDCKAASHMGNMTKSVTLYDPQKLFAK